MITLQSVGLSKGLNHFLPVSFKAFNSKDLAEKKIDRPSLDWKDGSVGRGSAIQARRLEFGSPTPTKNSEYNGTCL